MKSVTLEQWLAGQPGALVATVSALARSAARIGEVAAQAPVNRVSEGLDGVLGARPSATAISADRILAEALGECEHVAGWASADGNDPVVSDWHGESGPYLVVYDAFHGAAADEVNAPAATIFSILPHPFHGTTPGAAGFLQPGRRQVAAGYVLYGPATVMALSCGDGVFLFTVDRRDGRWHQTHAEVQVPATTSDFGIDAANQRYWEKPLQRYVAECVAGVDGPRGRDFHLRWAAHLVADAHRILLRGGVHLCPRDSRQPFRPGHTRLLFAAAPIAFLMDQSGGGAVTGTQPLLEVVPDTLHQCVPVIIGSGEEVQLIVRYHAEPSENVTWQLFKTRSLFVQPLA